jgi:hypothetical protein
MGDAKVLFFVCAESDCHSIVYRNPKKLLNSIFGISITK